MKKVLSGLVVLIVLILGAAVGGGYIYVYQPYLTTTPATANLQKIMAPEDTFVLHSMNLLQYTAIDKYILKNDNSDYRFSPAFGKLKFLKKAGLNLKTQASSLVASTLIPKGKLRSLPKFTFGISGNFPAKKIIKNLKKDSIVTLKDHNGSQYFEYKSISKIDCSETGPFAVYLTKDLLIQSSPELITFWIDRIKAGNNLKTADLTEFNKYQKLQLVTTQVIGLQKMITAMAESPQLKMLGKKNELMKLKTIFLTAGVDIEDKALALNISILANEVDGWQQKSLALKQKAKANDKNFKKHFPGFYGVIDAFYAKLNKDTLKLGVNINEKMVDNIKLLPKEFLFFALSGFDPSKAKASPGLAKKAEKIIEKLVPVERQFKFKKEVSFADFGAVTQYDNRPVYQYLKNNLGIYINEIEVIQNKDGEDQFLYKLVLDTKNNLNYKALPKMVKVYIDDAIDKDNQESIISNFNCGVRSIQNHFKFNFDRATKEVLIKPGTSESSIDKLSGRIEYRVPKLLAQMSLSKKDINIAQSIGKDSFFTLKKLSAGDLSYTITGDDSHLFKVRALNKDKMEIKKGPFSSFGGSDQNKQTDLTYNGNIAFIEVTYIKTFNSFTEKFEIPAKIATLKPRVISDETKIQAYSFKKYKDTFSTKKKTYSYKKIRSRKGRKSRKKRITKYIESWKPLTPIKFSKQGKKFEIEGIEVYLSSLGSYQITPKFEIRTHSIPELAGNSNAIGIEFHSIRMKDGQSYGPITAEEALEKDRFGRSKFRGNFGKAASWKVGANLKPGFFIKDVFEAKLELPLGRQDLKSDKLKSFKASLFFHLPTKIETLVMNSFDINSKAASDDFSLSIVKKKEGKIYFKLNGDFNKYLGAKVYNSQGETISFTFELATAEKGSDEKLYSLEPNGSPVKIEFFYGVDFEDKSFPFDYVNE